MSLLAGTRLIYTWLPSISTERPWLETPEEYRTRLKAAVAEVNATHDVDSLCKELPARVAQLILAEGGRLAK